MDQKRIAVIGGGLMGAGIAQTFAAAGHTVSVHEPDGATRSSLHDRVRDGLAALRKDPALAERIQVFDSLSRTVKGADFVTEAAPEKLTLKRTIFAQLEQHAPAHAILASNTSVMPIGSITIGLGSAHRMVGTHWWNPATLIPLVEVIQGKTTSDETIATTMDLLKGIGKKPAHVRKDVAGFVANRLQHALWREAIAMVADGICDAQTVDDCVKHSFGLRLAVLGPLENADMVGIDLTRDIHRTILPALNRDSQPNPVLDQMIDSGCLGFKSGEGFRPWSSDAQQALRHRLHEHLIAALEGERA